MDTLRARKVRSGLTILGIVIGVTSRDLGGRHHRGLERHDFGAGIEIRRRAPCSSCAIPAGSNPFQRLPEKIRLRKYLQIDDAQVSDGALSRRSAIATTFINRIDFCKRADSIRYGDAHVERFFLRGVEPEYLQALPLFSVAQGRFISEFDLEHARTVVVIGNAIARIAVPVDRSASARRCG